VVLTGIHLGHYGKDLQPRSSLYELLTRIASRRLLRRVRLSSMEPNEISPPLIRLLASSEQFCRHFHIPLQSGDNRVLRRMGRPYDQRRFRAVVERLHEAMPEAAIGVDVLAGFPGEDQEAFDGTRRLLETLPVAYLHVFPFSARPGTPAARYRPVVPPGVVKERARLLRRLGREKNRAFLSRLAGREAEVLIEDKRDRQTGLLRGLTGHYVVVLVEGDDGMQNRLARVRLGPIRGHRTVRGDLLSMERV
jgi:threonylcarbamoyladenosine tRNA methylthiotransferase MtaB